MGQGSRGRDEANLEAIVFSGRAMRARFGRPLCDRFQNNETCGMAGSIAWYGCRCGSGCECGARASAARV
eukprot:scaffold269512_cov31-Tisochrysis_lutea.AAC.3